MEMGGETVLEAIRRAGQELRRAPSRAELKRLTGVSHFVVLKHFPTLRHAVEAAGFTPHIKGRRASTAELLEDYGRVAGLLGRRPSRAEYVRAGRYSAGTFTQRFGGWVEAGEEWERSRASGDRVIGSSGDLESPESEKLPELPKSPELPKLENPGVSALQLPNHQLTQLPIRDEPPAFIWRPGQPPEIPGMRCVTEEVAAMIVAGLLGPRKWRLQIGEVEFTRAGPPQIAGDERGLETSSQHSAVSTQEELPKSPKLPELPGRSTQHPRPAGAGSAISTQRSNQDGTYIQLSNHPFGQLLNPLSNDIFISRRPVSWVEWRSPDHQISRSGDMLRRLNVEVISGRLKRDRPVMGPPIHAFAMTNAPCNEAGVAALFCMIAPDLGFQIEGIQAAFPDCEARRQVRPGKWQRVRIEFEYESRNFPLHHHDPSGCDMIVCWRHNWKKCPEEIEVLELRKLISIG